MASECGFTDGHYKALIRMKNVLSYTNKFEILAFPCNQFGAQEPGVIDYRKNPEYSDTRKICCNHPKI